MVGPSVGGLLFTIGQIAPFLADTISYLISILSLALVKTTFQEERGVRATTLRQEIVEGLRWVWHQPFIRFSLFLVAGSNLLFLAVAITACAMLGLAAAATLSRDVRSAPAIPEVQPT